MQTKKLHPKSAENRGGFMQGHFTPASLAFIVLGAFLISRANKKKEQKEQKKQWETGLKENE